MNLIKACARLAVVCIGIGLMVLHGRPVAAQTFFETGYAVTLEGDTLQGQIDNQEWIRNPEDVRFRSSEAAPVRSFTPHKLAAFFVSGELYERRVVRVDETPLRAGKLAGNSIEQVPSSRADTVFLAVLVKGALSLYAYRDERAHFYLEDRTGLRELIHHQYTTLQDGTKYQITKERYQEQVAQAAALNCPDVEVESISYLLPALKQFTEACNRRSASGTVRFVRETRRTVLRHELLVGASRTKLAVGDIDFSPSSAFTFGYALAFERGGAHGRRTVLLGLQLRSFEMHNLERDRGVYENWTCFYSGPCEGVRDVQIMDDMTIQARYLRASVGYRHQIWAGAWRPSVETDLVVAMPMRYRAEGEQTHTLYAIRGERPSNWDEVEMISRTRDQVAFLPANRVKPGVALGVGLAYRQLRAAWKVERTITISSAEFALPVFTQFTVGYAF